MDSSMPFLGRDISSGTKYSEKTKESIDEEVLDLVNSAYYSAIKVLSSKKEIFEKMTNKLIFKKDLGESDFQ
jgi:ATP-dependent Zn protease